MKEFDFDELDKAVNSLMGDVKKPDDSPTTTTLPELTKPVETPVSEAITPEPLPDITPPSPPAVETTSEVTPAPAFSLPDRPEVAVPATRRSGRFMDVVHPSSDMKSSIPARSREGPTLQPLNPPDETSTQQPVIDVVAPVGAPSVVEAAVTPPEDTPDATNEPPEAKLADTPAPSEPWSSPFLPDTQVEKRPLGGMPEALTTGLSEEIAAELSKEPQTEETAPAPSEIETPKESVASTETPSEKETPTEPAEMPDAPPTMADAQLNTDSEPAVMPAELGKDLLAIESGQKSASLEDSPLPPAQDTVATASYAAQAMSTASIPPQYDEQPSSGDSSHTPIYDNEAAHQTLAHPPKKKKSWVLIVFIVIILVVGGALGAAAYFLGLI